ncbi:MAG: ATP-dependent Clp protease proteolytic subunit [Roseburia faecis]
MKTGMSRTKLSHLMDAETWMDAHTAIDMGFADEILTRPAEIPVENNIAGSMLFSRASVINSLMDKLAAKCHIKKPEIPERSVDSLMKRLDLIKQTMIIPLKDFPRNLFFYLFSLPYCYLCLHPS